jgi:hypothetical protein
VEISPVFHSHPTEETWEKYVFDRLSDQDAATVEEHLLVCESCQASLQEVTEYIQLMKVGTASRHSAAADPLARGWRRFRDSAAQPVGRVVWITGLAVVCLALWRPTGSHPPSEITSVRLESFRGGGVAIAHAPARKPLDLSINASDVPTAPEYRMTVITSSGQQVWAGTPNRSDGMLSVHLAQGLNAGTYWVRLYSRDSEILGEYGLLLQ